MQQQYPTESKFLTGLEVDELPNGRWMLTQPLLYFSKLLSRGVNTPAGFDTDFCSVPRLPFVYAWLGNKFPKAGTTHDFIYRFKLFPRSVADSVLREASIVEGASRWEAFCMWSAVRVFGGRFYGGQG